MKPIRDLQGILDALRIQQAITFDESQYLIQEMHTKTGRSVWPGLSGNDVCAFANLVVARFGSAAAQPQQATGEKP